MPKTQVLVRVLWLSNIRKKQAISELIKGLPLDAILFGLIITVKF